jgi:hypothetical protein
MHRYPYMYPAVGFPHGTCPSVSGGVLRRATTLRAVRGAARACGPNTVAPTGRGALGPMAPLYPETPGTATNVSIFQHAGAAIPPLPSPPGAQGRGFLAEFC